MSVFSLPQPGEGGGVDHPGVVEVVGAGHPDCRTTRIPAWAEARAAIRTIATFMVIFFGGGGDLGCIEREERWLLVEMIW